MILENLVRFFGQNIKQILFLITAHAFLMIFLGAIVLILCRTLRSLENVELSRKPTVLTHKGNSEGEHSMAVKPHQGCADDSTKVGLGRNEIWSYSLVGKCV